MLSERDCRGCGGDGRNDEETTCGDCGGTGLSPAGLEHQRRCNRASQIVDGAALGLAGARREIYLGNYDAAVAALRTRAQELLDAANLIEAQATEKAVADAAE